MSAATTAVIDGRTLRSSRTRSAIIDAHRELLQRGELNPTTARIAAVAGVSARTLFLHFSDLQSLFAATTDAVLAEALSMARPVDPVRPLADRAADFLWNRFEIYSYLTPFALAARVRNRAAPAFRDRLVAIARASRDDVATAFAPELAALPADDHDDVLAALETAITWASWYHLREELDYDESATHRILLRSALSLLGRR